MDRKHLGALLFALLIAQSSIRTARACSCPSRTTKVSVSQSQTVFVGKVTRVEEYGKSYGAHRAKRAHLKVLDAWKGLAVGRVVKVDGGLAGGMCGVDFKIGHQYLVFANWDKKKQLGTDICIGTVPVEEAKDVIEELGKSEKPISQ